MGIEDQTEILQEYNALMRALINNTITKEELFSKTKYMSLERACAYTLAGGTGVRTFSYLIISKFGLGVWFEILDSQVDDLVKQIFRGSDSGGDHDHPFDCVFGFLNRGGSEPKCVEKIFVVIDRYYNRKFSLLYTVRNSNEEEETALSYLIHNHEAELIEQLDRYNVTAAEFDLNYLRE